ncbi:MAG: GNAT family N-acetyltransferase [Rhodobacter sp.]|nr:GNAT family N-acetyltransferase [Rhodobacter sp.]
MRLVTQRLVLRRACAQDLDGLHAVLSHPAAMRYWSTPEHASREQTRDFLRTMITEHCDDFIVEHAGQVIGKAGAWQRLELGYILHPDHWGKGLAGEALTALIPHLFAAHDAAQITAEVDPRNAPSIALLTRFGFHETHRAERTLLWRDEWCDTVYFALDRMDCPPAVTPQAGSR